MKFAEKSFSFYWVCIKVPTLVLVLWSIAGFIAARFYYPFYKATFTSIAGILISLFVFAFIGWCIVKDSKGNVKQSAWAGALAGIISGFVGGIIGILTYFAVPQLIDDAIAQAVSQGAPPATITSIIQVSIYLGLVTGPLINGIIGAIISSASGFIAKKF